MGKKDAQRTKGNTKAASSARSAQFLGENVGFIGFGTSAETAFVPLHSGSKDGTEEVSPDMKVVLRKMHKKDLTTKLKVGYSLQHSTGHSLVSLCSGPAGVQGVVQ